MKAAEDSAVGHQIIGIMTQRTGSTVGFSVYNEMISEIHWPVNIREQISDPLEGKLNAMIGTEG